MKVDPDSDWESVLAIAVMNRAMAMDADPDGLNFALYVPVETQADFMNTFDFTRIYEKGMMKIKCNNNLFLTVWMFMCNG